MQTEFIANASHELRTPLASIRMFVETLKMGRVRSHEDFEECIDALDKETARLSTLVERLLDFRAAEAIYRDEVQVAARPRKRKRN